MELCALDENNGVYICVWCRRSWKGIEVDLSSSHVSIPEGKEVRKEDKIVARTTLRVKRRHDAEKTIITYVGTGIHRSHQWLRYASSPLWISSY